MSRPRKAEPTQLIALMPKSRRESVAVLVAGSANDWYVELRMALTPPGERVVIRPHRFRLKPAMLREIAASLSAIADAVGAPTVSLPSPEQVEEDVRQAPAHLKELVRTTGTGKATILVANAGGLPFRSIASGPVVLLVDDLASNGPGDFNVDCIAMALRRSALVVLSVNWRIPDHYSAAALRAADGCSVVIIETKAERAPAWQAYIAAEVPNVDLLSPPAEVKTEPRGAVH